MGSIELAVGKAPIVAAAIDTDGRAARRPHPHERKAVRDPRRELRYRTSNSAWRLRA
jgi:hypothetical protein